jgi:hypothetical protein
MQKFKSNILQNRVSERGGELSSVRAKARNEKVTSDLSSFASQFCLFSFNFNYNA